jgi:hypothetical protein
LYAQSFIVRWVISKNWVISLSDFIMRRLTSVLLTVLVLLNLFGFYALFLLKQADIKEEVAEKIRRTISTEHCETLSFDKSEFAALIFNDNGSEFNYNGRLYDVVSVKNSGNRILVAVEYDANETALVETFGSLFSLQQDKEGTSSPVKIIISHFQQDYIIQYAGIAEFAHSLHTNCFGVNQSFPLSFYPADKPEQPPQFFLV